MADVSVDVSPVAFSKQDIPTLLGAGSSHIDSERMNTDPKITE
jgi:hypothetical protein